MTLPENITLLSDSHIKFWSDLLSVYTWYMRNGSEHKEDSALWFSASDLHLITDKEHSAPKVMVVLNFKEVRGVC